MSELNRELEAWFLDIIWGRDRGIIAFFLRSILRVFSWLFYFLVQLRLFFFRRRWLKQSYFGATVISIGNVTLGGTGKTPVVEKFAHTLTKKGKKVAILSRGYKSQPLVYPQNWKEDGKQPDDLPKIVSDGKKIHLSTKYAGDEPYMLAKNLPKVAVIVDKDRRKGAKFAINKLGCDVLILDDGLQNLALSHDLDIVLVDCQSPFGNHIMLPRGTLREPPKNLCRASHILLTKSDGSSKERLAKQIRKYNQVAPIIECIHAPKYLENVSDGSREELSFLNGKHVAVMSGIAVPQSFESLVDKLGGIIEIRRRFSDHYAFSPKEISQIVERCLKRDVNYIITTEKDAVRLPKYTDLAVPIYFLRIEIDLIRGQEIWKDLIEILVDSPKAGDVGNPY